MENIFFFLNQIDTELMISLNGSLTSPFADSFMTLFTNKITWIFLYLSIIYFLFKNLNWKTALIIIIGIVLTIVLSDKICSSVIRPYVGRLRPSHIDSPIHELIYIVNGKRGGGYGFPSAHATNTFALAVFIIMLTKNKLVSAFMLVWAFLNSYSRLYLGLHYPGDLIVGAILGSGIGYMMKRATDYSVIRILSKKEFTEIKEKIYKTNKSNIIAYVGIGLVVSIIVQSIIASI